ncbi:hypothetical protein GCM10027280_45760 [Micromonospora polyrhachis]|uniref:Uncharacterized protein n=1 Tax=Micromonospora polyrhachis TaxID=1282883 RepID=A0A7W7WPG6_9ACTN|nr:hypothetical protein [Micromonospora polyrhachis]MBB4958910.1 hypothetical protein [Micromonospora polyrhachis]
MSDDDSELYALARQASLLHDTRREPWTLHAVCPQCEPDGCMLDEWSRELLHLPPRWSLRATNHQRLVRPAWSCGTCGQPWPCSPARVELGEAYVDDPVGLLVHLCRLLILAAGETTVPAEELRERFIAWSTMVRD